MTTLTADTPQPITIAETALKGSAALWFLTAVIGQWIFAFYVVAFYGGSALRGDTEAINNNLVHGIIQGDIIGNVAVVTHLVLAVIITFGGPLQIVPQFRNRFPFLHRLNGRLYMATAFMISIGGLYMIWTRGTIGGLAQHLAISLNAVLIIVFAALALRHAIAREISTHRRWALRLFLAVSGVWFFRVGLMLWTSANKGPVGFDPVTFTGPFLNFLAFAQYLLPLAILELYFRTRASSPNQLVMAASLLVLTVMTGMGIFAATTGMWLPRI